MFKKKNLDKATIRSKYRKLREQLSEGTIDEMSLAIANEALKLPIWNKTYYHIFLPISEKKEVNTEFLLHILHGKDKSIVLPKTHFDTFEMEHILLQENTTIEISKYGIPEPVEGLEIATNKIEVVFIPLLAFDYKGNRVGYGKGFYDRFLKNCRPETLKIGLSLFKAEEILPFEENDIPLNFCISPKKTYIF